MVNHGTVAMNDPLESDLQKPIDRRQQLCTIDTV